MNEEMSMFLPNKMLLGKSYTKQSDGALNV